MEDTPPADDLQRLAKRGLTGAIVVGTVLALSGCGMEHIVSDARDAAIRNTATTISKSIDCFRKLEITRGGDLDALAKQNGLCGDWRTLGASDQELSSRKWDVSNNTWLIRNDESAGHPVITALTTGSGQAQVGVQHETHDVIVCWQIAFASVRRKAAGDRLGMPNAVVGEHERT